MLRDLWALWSSQFISAPLATSLLIGAGLAFALAVVLCERLFWQPEHGRSANTPVGRPAGHALHTASAPQPALDQRTDDPNPADSSPPPSWPFDVEPLPLRRVKPWGETVRVMIFMDHPNFGISWQTAAQRLGWPSHARFEWTKVQSALLPRIAAALDRPPSQIVITALHVYDSFVPLERLLKFGVPIPKARAQYGLDMREQMLTSVATLPRTHVHLEERTIKLRSNGQGRPEPELWPNGQIKTEEKGVDTAIAADLVRHAAHEHFDVAVLMADDTDYLTLFRTMRDHLPQPLLSAGFHEATRLKAVAWNRILFDADFLLNTRNTLNTVAVPTATATTTLAGPNDLAAATLARAPEQEARAGQLSANDKHLLRPSTSASPKAVLQPQLINRSTASPEPPIASVTARRPLSFGTIQGGQQTLQMAATDATPPDNRPTPPAPPLKVTPGGPAAERTVRQPSLSARLPVLQHWDAAAAATPAENFVGRHLDGGVLAIVNDRAMLLVPDGGVVYRGYVNRSSYINKATFDALTVGASVPVLVRHVNRNATLVCLPETGARADLYDIGLSVEEARPIAAP